MDGDGDFFTGGEETTPAAEDGEQPDTLQDGDNMQDTDMQQQGGEEGGGDDAGGGYAAFGEEEPLEEAQQTDMQGSGGGDDLGEMGVDAAAGTGGAAAGGSYGEEEETQQEEAASGMNGMDAIDALPPPISSALEAFNSQWAEELQRKKEAEDASKEGVKAQAQADLAKFMEDRKARQDAKMSANRNEEQNKLEQLEADLESDNPWERVVTLVDTQTDAVDDYHDTSRMKSIFIQLKNEPIIKKSSEEQ